MKQETGYSIRRTALVVLTGTLAAGCAAVGNRGDGQPAIPAGSSVQVNEVLALPTGAARVHIQGGRTMPQGDLNRFEPYCSFGLRKQAGDTSLVSTIRPGTFTTGASREGARTERERSRPVLVASRLPLWTERELRGGVGRLIYYVRVALHSPQQPQVDDLTCQYERDDALRPPYFTRAQIRTALGGLASIRVPGE